MMDRVDGLVGGMSPLLIEFLRRRRGMIVRIHQVRALLSLASPPALLVGEYNALADVLSGRRA